MKMHPRLLLLPVLLTLLAAVPAQGEVRRASEIDRRDSHATDIERSALAYDDAAGTVTVSVEFEKHQGSILVTGRLATSCRSQGMFGHSPPIPQAPKLRMRATWAGGTGSAFALLGRSDRRTPGAVSLSADGRTLVATFQSSRFEGRDWRCIDGAATRPGAGDDEDPDEFDFWLTSGDPTFGDYQTYHPRFLSSINARDAFMAHIEDSRYNERDTNEDGFCQTGVRYRGRWTSFCQWTGVGDEYWTYGHGTVRVDDLEYVSKVLPRPARIPKSLRWCGDVRKGRAFIGHVHARGVSCATAKSMARAGGRAGYSCRTLSTRPATQRRTYALKRCTRGGADVRYEVAV